MNSPKNQSNTEPKKQGNQLNTYARFTGIGFQMLVTIGLGAFAGVKLDERYPNQYSIFTIIFSLTSIGIALFSVIKQVTKFSNQKNQSNDKRNN